MNLPMQMPDSNTLRKTEAGATPVLLSGDPLATLQVRVHGDANLPTLIYFPGLHGDWTLVTGFRIAIQGRVRFVEISYPHTLTWSLDDYASAIETALLANHVGSGWLLGESFGSQIVWALLKRAQARPGDEVPGSAKSAPGAPASREMSAGLPIGTSPLQPAFQAVGVILAGGFVRHPTIWGVKLMHALSVHTPAWCQTASFCVFAQYAQRRHGRDPEVLATVKEFIRRRKDPLDQKAISHRLNLIAGNDPRPIARQTHLPVYSLAGLVDPLVPLPWVRYWLKRHCPAYRGGKTFLRADHNVLGTAPRASADQVVRWISEKSFAPLPVPVNATAGNAL